jgi:large subunit ribosomal protein L9
MELILLEKVNNLGNLGDKVKVRSGYGRNFLLPKGKAVAATASNSAEFEARRAQFEQNQADALAKAQQRAETLANVTVVIARRAGAEGKLFGSVNTTDIAEAVAATGVALVRQEVRLPNGALRMTGEYAVDVHLHTDVNTSVKIHVVAEE